MIDLRRRGRTLAGAGGQIRGGRARQEDAWALDFLGAREALAVLGDGLGGHPAGDIASRETVEAVRAEIRSRHRARDGDPAAWLEQGVRAADRRLHALQSGNREWFGMASTVVVLYVRGAHAWAASVGDSYLLRLRGGRLARLNELHTEEGALTSCVGFHLTQLHLPQRLPVRVGDRYVLASDGLATLGDEGVVRILGAAADPETAVRELLAAVDAVAEPRQDNATVIAIYA